MNSGNLPTIFWLRHEFRASLGSRNYSLYDNSAQTCNSPPLWKQKVEHEITLETSPSDNLNTNASFHDKGSWLWILFCSHPTISGHTHFFFFTRLCNRFAEKCLMAALMHKKCPIKYKVFRSLINKEGSVKKSKSISTVVLTYLSNS